MEDELSYLERVKTSLPRKMGSYELKVHAGNVAYQIWTQMPDPKLSYLEWYYGIRSQSLSESLENVRLEEVENA